MNDHSGRAPSRRGFFDRIAAVTALGLSSLAASRALAQPAPTDGPNWPGTLKGRHKQLFDIYTIFEGAPLGFTSNFLTPNQSATAVMIFRHQGLPYALNSAVWSKYKVGQTYNIIDPATKAPALKNPFSETLDRLMVKDVVIGVCGLSLKNRSAQLAVNAGVSADEALKDWAASIPSGATVLLSGTWGVNRAQEAGCTYCAGGG